MGQPALKVFSGEEHAPFFWQAGQGVVLLVHGFPGTPAEMRPLAEALHRQGWAVQGLLLPGFGAQIEQMQHVTAQSWVATTVESVRTLRTRYSTVLLLGYSMGGAVAIAAAAQEPVDGLILIAPFWRMSNTWQYRMWPLLRLFFSTIRPFKDTNFADPATRENIAHFLPEADLDDPAVQTALRQLEIPRSILDQVRRIGQMAYRSAPQVAVPGLVVQGSADEIVPLRFTRRLTRRLGAAFICREIDADHAFVKTGNGGFARLCECVLSYTAPFVSTDRRG